MADIEVMQIESRPKRLRVRRVAAAVAALATVGVAVNGAAGDPAQKMAHGIERHFDGPDGVDTTKPHKQIMITEPGETLWHVSKLANPDADRAEDVEMLRQDLPGKSVELQPSEIVPLPMDSQIGEVVPGEPKHSGQ